MYLKNRIEDLRIDADKTQLEIANILHCQREVYRRYEKGVREIPVWAAVKLIMYLWTIFLALQSKNVILDNNKTLQQP